jgi:hypothetical protein
VVVPLHIRLDYDILGLSSSPKFPHTFRYLPYPALVYKQLTSISVACQWVSIYVFRARA